MYIFLVFSQQDSNFVEISTFTKLYLETLGKSFFQKSIIIYFEVFKTEGKKLCRHSFATIRIFLNKEQQSSQVNLEFKSENVDI